MYIVKDSTNTVLRKFNTWREANNYRVTMNRFDWQIVETVL